MKITTHFENPPIPDRSMDWSAIDADTYDAEYIDGDWHSSCPVGRGPTERAAIDDLMDQLLVDA